MKVSTDDKTEITLCVYHVPLFGAGQRLLLQNVTGLLCSGQTGNDSKPKAVVKMRRYCCHKLVCSIICIACTPMVYFY